MQLPSELLDTLTGIEGFDRYAFEAAHNNEKQITSIRYNPQKLPPAFLLPPETNKIPWSSYGYYLDERPAFIFDPHFHGGVYYVQEASSMFLEEVMRQSTDLSEPIRVLDLCAAPGGKSTLIQSIISRDSILVSNEIIRARAAVLYENITKWGCSNVVVTNNDPREFSPFQNFFDVLIVDAPCSGSGLMRRDPEAINEWSVNNVELCCQRQQRILADAFPCLKQDGIRVYSTCSYSKAENENIVEWMMENFALAPIQLRIKQEWGIIEVQTKNKAFGYRFFPDKVKGEGFFISCLRKIGGGQLFSGQLSKQKASKLSVKEIASAQNFIDPAADVLLFHQNGKIIAFPSGLLEELHNLMASFYIRKAGVTAGKFAGLEMIPDHELALSTLLNNAIVGISLKIEDAIQYLRKEEVKVESNYKGWAVVKYADTAIGWVKILKDRVNNYYPVEWRILKR